MAPTLPPEIIDSTQTTPQGNAPTGSAPQVQAPQADTAILPGTPSVAPSPQVPSLVQRMSQATQVANGINATWKPGGTDAGDWARAINAGVQTALAGAGNIGKVPEGAGALYGIEKTMQGAAEETRKNVAQRMQQEEMRQQEADRQKELGMENQRLQDTEKYQQFMRDKAQAQSVRDMATFAHNQKEWAQQDAEHKVKLAEDNLDLLGRYQKQQDYLQQHDAKPFQIAGVDVPEFDSVDDAEKFANQHAKDLIAGRSWYPVIDASTGKVKLYDIKSEVQDWPITYADGTKGTFHGTLAQAMQIQDGVYRMEHDKALAQETQAEAQEHAQKLRDEMESNEAYEKYVNSGYDITKLDPKSRGVLFTFVKGIYDQDWNAYNKAHAAGDTPAEAQAMDEINQITPIVNQFIGVGQRKQGGGNTPPPNSVSYSAANGTTYYSQDGGNTWKDASGNPADSVTAQVAHDKYLGQQAQKNAAAKKTLSDDGQLVASYTEYPERLQAASQGGGVLLAPKNFDTIYAGLKLHAQRGDWGKPGSDEWNTNAATYIRQMNGEGGGAQQNPAASNGTVKMKAPDGSIKLVPQSQVAAAQAAGGVVVQ